MEAPVARDQGSFFCGPEGMMLLAPLPGGRWLTFQDLEEGVQSVSAEEVVSRTEARIGGRGRPTEVAWFSPFRMHRRIVSRLADGRRGPDPPRGPHRLAVPARRRGRARGPREPPLLVPDPGPDRIGAVKEAKGAVDSTRAFKHRRLCFAAARRARNLPGWWYCTRESLILLDTTPDTTQSATRSNGEQPRAKKTV
jgi:hypothetical protein